MAKSILKVALVAGGAASICLTMAACGHSVEQRSASGGVSGAVAGAVVGGPVGAVVGAAAGGAGGAATAKAEGER